MPDRSLTYSRAGASPIPSQPAWFHRLEEILADLRAMKSTQFDPHTVEKLFRVPQNRARQIMAGLEGLRVGNAAAVSREALIARLEQTAKLFELSRAMANDWPAFCRSVEENLPAPVRQDAFHRATSGRDRRWKV